MEQTFPTIEVFKKSALLPLQNPGKAIVSLFVMFGMALGTMILAIPLIILFASNLGDPGQLEAAVSSGNFDGLGGFLILYVVLILGVMIALAHVFNYWVNLAAFGESAASWPFKKGRFKASLINGLKLFLISVLIFIISLSIGSLLNILGLAPSFLEQMQNTDIVDQTLSSFTSGLLAAIATAIIYSVFSSNLTQTAIGDSSEGLEHPHNVDFAIVIIMLYGLYLIPTVLAALTGSTVLTAFLTFLLSFYLIFAVPAAHGLRYRVCAAENADGPE